MADIIDKIRELKMEIKFKEEIKNLKFQLHQIKKLLGFITNDKKKLYRVEKKFNGFHAVIHKKGDEVKIFSEQKKDISAHFKTLKEEIKKLSDKDFIIDGEIVPYDNGKALGRNELMKFLGKEEVDDSNVKLHVWDITYYDGKDLTSLPLKDRLIYLKKLNFTDRITDTPGFVVSTKEEMRNAIEKCASMPGSEGAIIKDMNAPYCFDETCSSWLKYRHLVSFDGVVIKKNQKERAYTYLIGIYVTKNDIIKYNLDPDYILTVNGKRVLKLGNTFNTSKEAKEGDIAEISVEEIWRHVTKNGVHYSIHKPRFMGVIPEKSSSSVKDLEDIVSSIGVRIEEFDDKFTVEFDVEEHSKMITDWPDWVQQPLKVIKEKGAWMPFVIQHHYRGHVIENHKKEGIPDKYVWNLKSLHSDLRCFLPRNYEKIKEGQIIKYEEAKNVDGLCFGITVDTPPSVDKPDEFNNGAKNVLCEFKLPIPKEWLYVEGIAEIGEPGSTKNAPGLFVIVAKGEYTAHEVGDHKIVLEFKCRKGKVNQRVFEEADKKGIFIKNKFDSHLKDLKGYFVFTINHIGNKHIILLNHKDKVKMENMIMNKEMLNLLAYYTKKENYSRKQIAELLNVSPSTVYRYQKLLGLL